MDLNTLSTLSLNNLVTSSINTQHLEVILKEILSRLIQQDTVIQQLQQQQQSSQALSLFNELPTTLSTIQSTLQQHDQEIHQYTGVFDSLRNQQHENEKNIGDIKSSIQS